MPSLERSQISNQPKDINREQVVSLLANNDEMFKFLLAFVRMSKGFRFAFVEVNFPPDIEALITALQEHPDCQMIQFLVLQFDDPSLHFVLEKIQQALGSLEIQPDKKLVLLIRGLEKAIALTGDNPPFLTNLNFARDAFPSAVPYPVVFILPDYAVTRFALFAPDFWAWTSATFKFQTPPETRDRVFEQVFSQRDFDPNRTYAKPERSERIDLLERLLQEYPEDTEASGRTRLEILNQLGEAHQSIREFDIAKLYYQQSLELSRELHYEQGEADALHQLGRVCCYLRQFMEAQRLFQQSLVLKEKLGDKVNQAKSYHMLGIVAQELREYEQAQQYYQQALAIDVEYDDRYSQASTYHQLGVVAEELREYEQAQQYYQQALVIKVEIGDRYSQASTCHQLGNVAEELRKYEQAQQYYQQAFAICVEFGDRYNQAGTYHQLGNVAIELREYEQAQQYYQQALAIYVEFGDRYNQARTYHCLGIVAEALGELSEAKEYFLQAFSIWTEFKDEYFVLTISIPSFARIYQATQDPSILEAIAQVRGITVEEVLAAISGATR